MISEPLIFYNRLPFSRIDFALWQWFHEIKHFVFPPIFNPAAP